MGAKNRHLTIEEVRATFAALGLERSRLSPRNQAMFAFGCFTGFRAEEILSVRLGAVLTPAGSLRPSVMVGAEDMKGGKLARSVTLTNRIEPILRPWLDRMREYGLGLPDHYLFCQLNGKRLTYGALYNIVTRAYKKADVRKTALGTVATHAMRKTYAMDAFNEGMSVDPARAIFFTRDALGHKDIASTERH